MRVAPAALLDLYDRELRIEIEHPGTHKETFPGLVRFTRPAPGMNFISYSRLDRAALDDAIEAQVAHFLPLSQPFEWLACAHDAPPELGARLTAHGFEADTPGAIMVLDLSAVPAALQAPAGADIRTVTTRAGLEDVIRVEQEVWGGDFGWMRQRMGDHLAIPDYLSLYVAYVDGEPAAVAWTYFYAGHFAGLFGGSTVARHRGRGLYRLLLAARAQEALRRGYAFLTVNANDQSGPIVARHGFFQLTTAVDYEWPG